MTKTLARSGVLLTSALALTGGLVFSSTARAHAGEQSCTPGNKAALCLVLDTTAGTHVDRAEGMIYAPGWHCGLQFRFTGTLYRGGAWSSTATASCGAATAWADVYPNQSFKPNTMFCVAYRDDSKSEWYYDKACLWIES